MLLILLWLLLFQMTPYFFQWALDAATFLHVISQCSIQVDVLYNKIFRSGVLCPTSFVKWLRVDSVQLRMMFSSLDALILAAA